MSRNVLVTYSDRKTGKVLDRVIRPAPARMQPCSAGCGKLTRGGCECFACAQASWAQPVDEEAKSIKPVFEAIQQ